MNKPSIQLWSAVITVLVVSAALRFIWLDRYPLGWHHDEALMGVIAGEVYRGENRPVFFPQYLGQEPLYIYLAAGMMAPLGGDQGLLPLRLTSAFVGLSTVVLTLVLGRAMFSTRVGLLAMALAGFSFWQVMSSRNGYRSVTQPLFEALAVYLLWQALSRKHMAWYALTGAALGAVLYTYLAARAFPIVFVSFSLWILFTRRRITREGLLRTAALAGAAFIVAAPLLGFFLAHPETFAARMEQVFVLQAGESGGSPWSTLLQNIGKALQSFTISGEPLWRYNISGRPVFVGLLVLAFYGGLAVLLWETWKRNDAAAFVFIWLGVMLAPSLLSSDLAFTLRAIGLVPALYFVPALGLDWLLQRIAHWRPRWQYAAPAIGIALLLVETAWTARDYFVTWAPSFGASWEGGADAVAQARFLLEHARPEREEIFVGSEYYHHATLAHLAQPVYPNLHWFTGQQSLVFPTAAERPVLYVLGFNGMPSNVSEFFPRETLVAQQQFLQGIDGNPPPPLALAYRLSPEQVRAQAQRIQSDPRLRPVIGRIHDLIEPLSAYADGPVRAGDPLTVELIWRIQAKPAQSEYQLAVHLLDHRFEKVSGVDAAGYPSPEWQPGDVVWSQFTLPVPENAPAGLYKLHAFFYDSISSERLHVAEGVAGIPALVLPDVRVQSAEPLPPEHSVGTRLGEYIVLDGFDAPSQTDRNRISVKLYWHNQRQLVDDYVVFVQLLNSQGTLVAQSDSWPAQGALPTSAWLAGELVRDEHQLTLPEGMPSGEYRLIAGAYLLESGLRLSIERGQDHVELTKLSLP